MAPKSFSLKKSSSFDSTVFFKPMCPFYKKKFSSGGFKLNPNTAQRLHHYPLGHARAHSWKPSIFSGFPVLTTIGVRCLHFCSQGLKLPIFQGNIDLPKILKIPKKKIPAFQAPSLSVSSACFLASNTINPPTWGLSSSLGSKISKKNRKFLCFSSSGTWPSCCCSSSPLWEIFRWWNFPWFLNAKNANFFFWIFPNFPRFFYGFSCPPSEVFLEFFPSIFLYEFCKVRFLKTEIFLNFPQYSGIFLNFTHFLNFFLMIFGQFPMEFSLKFFRFFPKFFFENFPKFFRCNCWWPGANFAPKLC